MALPSAFVNLVDTHGASLQNLALLAYLRKGEEAKPFLEGVTAARAYVDMNRTLFSSASSSEAALERARTEAILNVSKWVKEHPRARPSEVQAKVEEEVAQFKIKIQGL